MKCRGQSPEISNVILASVDKKKKKNITSKLQAAGGVEIYYPSIFNRAQQILDFWRTLWTYVDDGDESSESARHNERASLPAADVKR